MSVLDLVNGRQMKSKQCLANSFTWSIGSPTFLKRGDVSKKSEDGNEKESQHIFSGFISLRGVQPRRNLSSKNSKITNGLGWNCYEMLVILLAT